MAISNNIIADKRGLILPTPALHLRDPGPLFAGFRTNWENVRQTHGKTRFRVRAYHPDLPYMKRVLDPLCKVWIDDPEDAWGFWQRIHTKAPSWFPGLEENPGTLYAVDTVTFLTTTGSNSYTKPTDWNNAANHIEAVGAGSVSTNVGNYAQGGGGGAYCRANNQTISSSTTYQVGIQNSGTSSTFGASVVSATAATANSTAGGTTGSSGTVNYAGGNGSAGGAGSGTQGGGGGGAAGPTGAGTSTVSSNGGSGDAGFGGAGGVLPGAAGAGNPGGNGTEWDASHGSGGGGSGADGGDIIQHTGGNAGSYGAGSGGDAFGAAAASLAYQGIIVITYTPLRGLNRMFSVF